MADITGFVEKLRAKDSVGVPVPILQRNGKPYLAADKKTRSTMTLIGSESEEFRQKRDAIWQAAGESTTDDEKAAIRIAVAAAAVKDWAGWEDPNGQVFACTPDNVKALLSLEHILLQVEAGVQRRTDFFDDASSS